MLLIPVHLPLLLRSLLVCLLRLGADTSILVLIFWVFFAAFMARSSPDGYEKVGMESFTLATVSVRAVHARARPALTRGQKR